MAIVGVSLFAMRGGVTNWLSREVAGARATSAVPQSDAAETKQPKSIPNEEAIIARQLVEQSLGGSAIHLNWDLPLFLQDSKDHYGISVDGSMVTSTAPSFLPVDVLVPSAKIRELIEASAKSGHKAEFSVPYIFDKGYQNYYVGVRVVDAKVGATLLDAIKKTIRCGTATNPASMG